MRGSSDLETGHRSDWGQKAYQNMGLWGDDLSGYLGYEAGSQFSSSQAELFDAPAIVYLTMHRNSPFFSIFDMGAFSQSLMLAAKERGVDSMEAYEFVKFPDAIRKLMGSRMTRRSSWASGSAMRTIARSTASGAAGSLWRTC